MGIMRKDGTRIIIDEALNKNSNILMIILGGYGYTLNHPVLYYAKSTAKELSCDYLGIDFDYKNNPIFLQKADSDKDDYFEEDNILVKEYIKEKSKVYQKIVFIGKSMGTSIIKRLLDDNELLKKSASVLITPGTEWSSIIKKIVSIDNPIVVIGSISDCNYRVEGLGDIYSRENIMVVEIKDASHALETGNVVQDLEILKNVISTIKEFVKGQFV